MYKAIKSNKIIAVSDTDSRFNLLVKDFIETDTEHTVADFTMVGSEYVLNDDDKAIEVKKEAVRDVRNSYLETYVDPFQLVIRWGTLSETEQGYLVEYRQYLLDYTSSDSWWEQNPDDYETWLIAHHPVEE